MRKGISSVVIVSLLAQSLQGAPEKHGEEADRDTAPTADRPRLPEPHKENTKLLTRLFKERESVSARHDSEIRWAIEEKDDELTVQLITDLVYSRADGDEKQALLEALQAEIKKAEVQADPKRKQLVERLLWVTEEVLKVPGDTSPVAKKIKEKVAAAYEKARQQAKLFKEKRKLAADGDEEALKWLYKEYGKDVLTDFAVAKAKFKDGEITGELMKAMGWSDTEGEVHVDVEKPGATPDASPSTETWTLGKTNPDIAKNLVAFDRAGHGEGEPGNVERVTPRSDVSGPRRFKKIDAATSQPVEHKPHLLYPEDKQICKINHPVEKEVPTKKHPNYFFRPFPTSPFGSYAGVDENFILNMETGEEQKMPGSYDPVPTPDEKYMTIPADDNSDPKKGLTFFKMKDLQAGNQEPLFTDTKMKGVYQSLGILSEGEGGATTYRAITAQRGHLRVRDYKLTPTPTGVRVEPQGADPKVLCHNLTGVELSLPMISKTGRQLAAVDVAAGVTKIYSLADDGSCTEEVNLGMFTGKVDFNYDNDLITFHKYNNEVGGTRYIQVPSDDVVSNVYVYRRSTGEIARLTHNTDSNSVYPAFRKDGKIVFLQHPRGAANDTSGPSRLVVVDPEKAKKSPIRLFVSGPGPGLEKRYHVATALGALWANLCSPYGKDISDESAVLSALGLDRDRCLNMVNKYWNDFKDGVFAGGFSHIKKTTPAEFQALKSDDLAALCPKEREPERHVPVDPRAPGPRTPEAIVRDCKQCHEQPGVPLIPWDDPAALKRQLTTQRFPAVSLAEDILRRLGASTPANGRMPPGYGLKAAEQEAVITYLKLR